MNSPIDTAARGDAATPGVRGFVVRRLSEAGALVLAALAVGLLVALATFDPSDPSFNAAVAHAPKNLLGLPGAWSADVVLQSMGLSGLQIILVFAAWSWRLAAYRGLGRVWLRLTLLPAALLLGCLALAAVPPPAGWPLGAGLGGLAGDIVFDELMSFAGPVAGLTPLAAGLIAGAAGMAAWIAATGLRADEWRRLAGGLGWLAVKGARASGLGIAMLGRALLWTVKSASDGRGAAGERREPVLDGGRERDGAARRPGEPQLVAPQRDRLTAGKRATAARQARLDFGSDREYELPTPDLLDTLRIRKEQTVWDREALEQNARLLETVLDDFGVRGDIVKVRPGPVVTLYELEPAPGTKSSRVIGLADDIARSMSAVSVRVAVIPGRNVIGIELPNNGREIVSLRELLSSHDYERSSGQLTLMLGKDIGGAPVMVDLARMPHLLIAGTTGSGKSVAINTMILSMLFRLSPEHCKFIMIDPKMLELSVYDGIPHLLAPVVTDPGKSVVALRWVVREMERRYRDMSTLGVRNIAGFNARLAEARKKDETLTRMVQTGFDPATGEPVYENQALDLEPLPFIVVIVDEMADLMLIAGKEVEAAVQRLAQMARAAGIHLIMATQRPSVDVITGTIKANFPTRVSFQVTSKIDSRTILGEGGAEQLLGQGDMLYMAGGGRITRVHGPFVSDEEVERVVAFLRGQAEPNYIESVTEDDDPGALVAGIGGGGNGGGDDLYDQAVALVCRERRASTSFVQRHLQVGYNRAARIIERMESEGVVSPANHVGKREVLARDIDSRAY